MKNDKKRAPLPYDENSIVSQSDIYGISDLTGLIPGVTDKQDVQEDLYDLPFYDEDYNRTPRNNNR